MLQVFAEDTCYFAAAELLGKKRCGTPQTTLHCATTPSCNTQTISPFAFCLVYVLLGPLRGQILLPMCSATTDKSTEMIFF